MGSKDGNETLPASKPHFIEAPRSCLSSHHLTSASELTRIMRGSTGSNSRTTFVALVLMAISLDSQAFVLQGTGLTSRQKETPSKVTLSVDRDGLFRAGSAHPDSYLPGSPHQSNRNPTRFRDPNGLKADRPSSLSVDRSEVFRPVRPADSHITRTSPMRSSSKPSALEVDVPGHFQSGNAFVSGSLARQDYSGKAAPRATRSNVGIESFSVDRSEVFRPLKPHEKTTQPVRRASPLSPGSKPLPATFSVDHPDTYRPARAFDNQSKSESNGRPTNMKPHEKTTQPVRRTNPSSPGSNPLPAALSVHHPDAYRPARAFDNQRKSDSDRRPANFPTSFEVDTPGHFQTGSVFGRGSATYPTAYNPNKNQNVRRPSAFSVDHPNAYTARPTSNQPSLTSQQLGLAGLDQVPSFPADKPSAFKEDPNWKK